MKLNGLYGIKDDANFRDLYLARCGGMRIFQLRDKNLNDISKILKIRDFCARLGIVFILNDYVNLAINLNLEGLHIGFRDCDLASLRARFGGIIGVSCYDNISMAIEAQTRGADYVAFGAIYPTHTKQNATPCPIEVLIEAKKRLNIPVCAIGGITTSNVSNLVPPADMIAVISGLWRGDVKSNALNLSRFY